MLRTGLNVYMHSFYTHAQAHAQIQQPTETQWATDAWLQAYVETHTHTDTHKCSKSHSLINVDAVHTGLVGFKLDFNTDYRLSAKNVNYNLFQRIVT